MDEPPGDSRLCCTIWDQWEHSEVLEAPRAEPSWRKIYSAEDLRSSLEL